MGSIQIFLCVSLAHLIAAQLVIKKQDATFFQDVEQLVDNIRPFPFESNFDFTPYDTIFSSWRTLHPDFHKLAELPPTMIVPRVEVFCDDSKLTLLVDKSSNGVILTREELQLGGGCYSNRQLPNQFVFAYSLDECGTTPVMQNGLVMFSNSLHLNLKKHLPTGGQTPSTVRISCIPKRSYTNLFDSTAFPETGKNFNIKAMNPTWTGIAETNIYKRGQVVNLQVSAKVSSEQKQLFIPSCFVSASPEPQTKPRHAVIMNKGCAAPLGSPHAVVQFVASGRADVVNLVLNTSYLISELYIHCSVLKSDQGVNTGSKSCNYNMMQSRWEDLRGNAEVCECCSSKCRGLSVKHLSEDAKSVISTGPLLIVDKHVEMSPQPAVPQMQEPNSAPHAHSMQSDGAAIVSGASLSRLPQGVVVVSQDPVARLTLWLPEQVQDPEHDESNGSNPEDHLKVKLHARDTTSKYLPEQPPLTSYREPLLNTPTNKFRAHGAYELNDGHILNLLTLVNELAVHPQMEKGAFAHESQIKEHFGRPGMFEAQQEIDTPLIAELTLNILNPHDLHQMRDELAEEAVMPREDVTDSIIHSKVQFSKGMDGSQTLSYEEEVMREQEGKGVSSRFWMDGNKIKQEPKRRGLRSVFLDLLRRMDKAE
ncbi:hypothetical protein PBY51_010420 [Eleginops maclovinus]|uniref:ZP domain-containing protein n=1 Tax=Eleginops maclovinus TaxID=56733 RepID=A0AAN8AEQ4_ELEMC|nr:hypothetical protein PBY51_010420 [Eleginops maclovinus]